METHEFLKWLFGGIGASAITILATSLYGNIARNLFPYAKKVKKYRGFYAAYHISTSESETVEKLSIRMMPDKLGRMKVRSHSPDYKYAGSLILKDSNIYLKLKGIGHDEYTLWVLREPLASSFEIIAGIFSGVAESRFPVAGKIVLVRSNTETYCGKIDLNNCNPGIRKFLNLHGNPLKIQHSFTKLADLNNIT